MIADPTLVAWPIAGLVGACAGSFAATAAVRAGRSESALTGHSRCDGCGASLGFAATIPLVSYLQRRGACAACGGRIDRLHPMGEIAGVLAGVVLLAAAPLEHLLLLAPLGGVLLTSALVDARTRRLPDVLTFVAAVLCAGLALQRGAGALAAGAVAATLALLILEGLRRASMLSGRAAALGFGDVKLLAALALWLGPLTPWAVVGASALGLIFILVRGRRGEPIAFGPWIALAAWIVGLVREAGAWPGLSWP